MPYNPLNLSETDLDAIQQLSYELSGTVMVQVLQTLKPLVDSVLAGEPAEVSEDDRSEKIHICTGIICQIGSFQKDLAILVDSKEAPLLGEDPVHSEDFLARFMEKGGRLVGGPRKDKFWAPLFERLAGYEKSYTFLAGIDCVQNALQTSRPPHAKLPVAMEREAGWLLKIIAEHSTCLTLEPSFGRQP